MITHFRWVINQNCSSPVVVVQHPPPILLSCKNLEKSHSALAVLPPHNPSITSVSDVSVLTFPRAKPQGTLDPSLCKRKPFCP